MSISSDNRKAGPFSCNGLTVNFPFEFKVFSDSDVLVVSTDLLGTESTLELTTDYTVSLNADQDADPGGSVDFAIAPLSGYKITLTSSLENIQPATLTNNGGFYPRVINDALDRLTIMVQQVAEKVSRALTVDISSSMNPSSVIAAIFTAETNATAAAASAASDAAFIAASALPSQSGKAGKFLTTNGTATDWAVVDALPSQTGNNGKFLTTDGASPSWTPLNTDANITTKGLYENNRIISADYYVSAGNNAMSAGPITINSGVTVTVPSGSTWTVV